MNCFKTDDRVGPIYQFQEGNTLLFIYKEDLKLYMTIYNKDNVNSNNVFTIYKDETNTYKVFEQLFKDFKEINIFNDEDHYLYIKDDCQRDRFVQQKGIDNNLRKHNYKMFNRFQYNDIYDEDSQTITWCSEDKQYDILKIKKEDDNYSLKFLNKPKKSDVDTHYISVKINEDSANPFSILFLKVFEHLNSLDAYSKNKIIKKEGQK